MGLTLLTILCLDFAFGTCGASRGKKIGLDAQSGADIECVDFYKQPAFDNPLLKNHTIQRRPTGDLTRSEVYGMPNAKRNETMYRFKGCPEGMVPILRTTRGSPPESFALDFAKQDSNKRPKAQVASIYMYEKVIFGARASVGIHKPRCGARQTTGSLIRLVGENMEENIVGGWAIDPAVYGDARPRVTIFWSTSANERGCLNTLCPGFVQVAKDMMPGAYVDPPSVYDGNTYEMTFEIRQDPNTKNWWFSVNNVNVGYWPKELFSNLEKGGRGLFFGGLASSLENGNPQMGFGKFPGKSIKHSGFMRHVKYINGSGTVVDPTVALKVETSPHCYKVGDRGVRGIDEYIVLFGGPGGTRCP